MNLDAREGPGELQSARPTSQQKVAASTASLEQFKHQSATQILIEPEESGLGFGFGEIWRFRELLYFLTLRDIQIRYKQTLLGAAWAIIQPLFAMLLFTLFFGRLARIPSDNIPYPLFAYAGLLLWTFFANSVTNSANSLVGSASLITKIYFPRMIIPAAPVLAGLLDLAIAFGLVVPLLIYYRVSVSWQVLLLPIFICLTTLLAFGVGMWMAALNVKYRDVRYALPFTIQLWLFASPVIYPLSIMPAKWRWLLLLNPMTGIIEGLRSSLFGRDFDWTAIGVSALITLLIVPLSAILFRRVEDSFADVI
jgi:lipopolysaccharide transport system permease protein